MPGDDHERHCLQPDRHESVLGPWLATGNKFMRLLKKAVWSALHRFGYDIRRSEEFAFEDQAAIFRESGAEMIFDVGANQGLVASRYREMFPKAAIHCFEPLPDACGLARKRFENDQSVSVHECAVGAVEGKVTFNRNSAADSSSLLSTDESRLPPSYAAMNRTVSTLEIGCVTIDAFCARERIERIDILKMDVQGGELGVLKGAARLLREHRIKLIYSEVYFLPFYRDQPLFEDICSFLAGHGYRFLFPYGLVFGSSTGRLQWGDAIFVSPDVAVDKARWILGR